MGKLRNPTACVSAGNVVMAAHPSQQMPTLLSHMYDKPMLLWLYTSLVCVWVEDVPKFC